jgi:hypothetical protein
MENIYTIHEGKIHKNGIQLELNFSDEEQKEVFDTSSPEYLYTWIAKNIETSITLEHIESCRKLKELFIQKFSEQEYFITQIDVLIHERLNILNYL